MQSQIPLTVQILGLSLVLKLHNFLINEPAALAVTPMKMQIRNVHGQLPKLHLLLSLRPTDANNSGYSELQAAEGGEDVPFVLTTQKLTLLSISISSSSIY